VKVVVADHGHRAVDAARAYIYGTIIEESAMQTVGIRKLKRPRGYGRWQAYVLAEDAHGLWLYSPAGSRYRGSDGHTTAECEVGQGNRDAGLRVVSLIPCGGWWIATWTGNDPEPGRPHVTDPWISVDICTPPSVIVGEWTYVDLELDPHRSQAGRVWIDDEDEFEAACRAGLISREEQTQARLGASETAGLLRASKEPFGGAGWDRLHAGIEMRLPPLTDLLN
jgi:hypothetical protein